MKSIRELLIEYWYANEEIYFKVDSDHSNARRVIMALRGLKADDYGTASFPLQKTWYGS